MRDSRGVHLSITRVDEEIFARNAVYRYELLSRRSVTPPPVIAEAFGPAAALHIRCRHWADDRVFQIEDRWINLQAVPAAVGQPFQHYGPNRWLLENVPFSDVQHEICAVAADKTDAKTLCIRTGHPLLQIIRKTVSGDLCVIVATLKHPGELFSLSSDPVVQ